MKEAIIRWLANFAIAWLTRKIEKLQNKINKAQSKLDKKVKQVTSEYIDEEF